MRLEYVDLEDFEDFLLRVEDSFCFNFVDYELAHVMTFGQFCDHVIDKIKQTNSSDCTSQQAFYKIRDAISKTLQLEKTEINPSSDLIALFSRKSRRLRIKNIENILGFKINILRPPYGVTILLTITSFLSLAWLLFNWQIGLVGFTVSIFSLWFIKRIGNELDLESVGQIAEKIVRENYFKSRRNKNTFNKNEIEKVLTDLFCYELRLDKETLTRDSKLPR
jgi:hypothetical protein